MKALVFGSNSDIGKEIIKELEFLGYEVIKISKQVLNFSDPNSDAEVQNLLYKTNPDVIINSVGVFEDNNVSHHTTMNVNFGSSWSIIKYYTTNINLSVKVILIGSSAYKKGKKEYMLYSASKAALYNLWEGATDFFKDSKVSVNLINPVRVNTKMIADIFNSNLSYLEPTDVAKEVTNLLTNNLNNVCIDMKYKDTK